MCIPDARIAGFGIVEPVVMIGNLILNLVDSAADQRGLVAADEVIVGDRDVVCPFHIERAVAVCLVRIDMTVSCKGVVALFDCVVVDPDMLRTDLFVSGHGNAVIRIVTEPEIPEFTACAALHFNAPVNQVCVRTDAFDGDI